MPGFKATIPFTEGIKRTLSWLNEDDSRKFIDPEAEQKIEKVLKAYNALGGVRNL